ncbi:hypothetical protein [Butyricicoccus sp.]|uniref:transmembrane-type terpene cyclase n=1 Tax=Butyricicoccus sp. TaxID=2049021 RepID=UPI003F73F1C6
MQMELFLTLLSGIGWMIVYEECIRLGFRDKTYSMPFYALGLNFSWELINFVGEIMFHWHGALEGMTLIQTAVNGFWAGLDVVILFTYVKFGRKKWEQHAPGNWFVPWTILGLICCFALQIIFIVQFGGVAAAEYSAFLQNLLMSILFIDMYWKRGSMEGQSILLAVAKWIGTLAPTILMGCISFHPYVLCCGIFCSVFDLIYIALLLRHHKLENK